MLRFNIVLTQLRSVFVEIVVQGADKECSASYIAECGGQYVGGEHCGNVDIGAKHYSEWYKEHICHTVFIAECHECEHGNFTGKEFFTKTSAAERKPYGKADAPVSAYSLEENNAKDADVFAAAIDTKALV